ncbi:hypothetical protein CANARDRAFT_182581, partial [[Candida] arabinofermentans NRRL YB-2248]
DDSMYMVDLLVGSDEQPITAQIDTGSSDFWVFANDNIDCGYNPYDIQGIANCYEYGTFDLKSSKTFDFNSTFMTIEYGDASIAKGVVGSDDVRFEDFTVDNLLFGVCELANSSNPVMGIGFQSLQSVYTYDDPPKNIIYESLPFRMTSQGLINQPAYSIQLLPSSFEVNSSILFGAVDHSKYTGQLTSFPVAYAPDWDVPSYVGIKMNAINFIDSDGVNSTLVDGSAYAYVDTGTSNSQLPTEVYDYITSNYFTYEESENNYYADCSSVNSTYLDFNFLGVSYVISLGNFVNDASDYEEGMCSLSISSTDSYICFGDDFLRSVYLAVNLETEQIAMAYTN